jgi:hypothetical protein
MQLKIQAADSETGEASHGASKPAIALDRGRGALSVMGAVVGRGYGQ